LQVSLNNGLRPARSSGLASGPRMRLMREELRLHIEGTVSKHGYVAC
jgi:hypothetical protein